jgi:rhodanese-related sulfurtransferase
MSVAAIVKKLFGKPYGKVGARQAAALVESGALLLDVREAHEWHAGHAPRARHIPLAQLERRLHELPPRREIVTVCRSGARSARAAAVLASHGRQVSNLAGGMHAWARAGLPLVAKGGAPGRVG